MKICKIWMIGKFFKIREFFMLACLKIQAGWKIWFRGKSKTQARHEMFLAMVGENRISIVRVTTEYTRFRADKNRSKQDRRMTQAILDEATRYRNNDDYLVPSKSILIPKSNSA